MALPLGIGVDSGWWHAAVMCGEHCAGDRAAYLVRDCGKSEEEAQSQISVEFPDLFRLGFAWDPDVDCDGSRACDRAQWLISNKGLSQEAAERQVVIEFPGKFNFCSGSGWELFWSPDSDCDGHEAAGRAQWLEDNKGLDVAASRRQVMAEFPAKFLWHSGVTCDGSLSCERVAWLEANKGKTTEQARSQVRLEFPAQFCPGLPAGDPATNAFSMGGAVGAPVVLEPMSAADPARLVWFDDFDYEGAPDPAKWGFDEGGDGWGNGELQHYTARRDNAWVTGGSLNIRALREDFGTCRFTSARLVTKGLGDWTYGRVEVRAKLPTGKGTWPAIWMLPTDWSFGGWPKSGEIDIMEHVGWDVGRVHGTVHTDKYNHSKNTQVGKQVPVEVDKFHTYAIEWLEDRIEFGVDGQRYHCFRNDGSGSEAWPFDRRFHLLLNVAVGGAWGGQKGIDDEALQGTGQIMQVASVRVYGPQS